MNERRCALLGTALWIFVILMPLASQDNASGSVAYISPNLDGIRDSLVIPISISDERQISSFNLIIRNQAGTTVRTVRNKETRPETANFGNLWERFLRVKEGLKIPSTISWDGRDDNGIIVPDGTYTYQVEASDDNNNTSRSSPHVVVVDTLAPVLKTDAPETAFAPGGDRPALVINTICGDSLSPIDRWTGSILDLSGKEIKTWQWTGSLPPQTIWDGKTDKGIIAPDGVYTFRLQTRDRAGNHSSSEIPNLLLINQQTPLALTIDNAAFSPNGDGIKDTVNVTVQGNDKVKVQKWTATLLNSKSVVVRTLQGTDPVPRVLVVDGKDDKGMVLPEDQYHLSLDILYINGNKPHGESPPFALDLTKPQISITPEYPVFSPNGDGFKDVLPFHQKASTEAIWQGQIVSTDTDGRVVRSWKWRGQPDEVVVWDGRDEKNAIVPDGEYSYQVLATDQAGNTGFSTPIIVRVDNRPTVVTIRPTHPAFSPGSSNANAFSTIDFELTQNLNEGIESWSVRVLSVPSEADRNAATLGTGTLTFAWSGTAAAPPRIQWDGKTASGAIASDGSYVAEYRVVYNKGDKPLAYSVPFAVDTRKPEATVTVDNLFFSPDGDGKQDTITFTQTTSEEDTWVGTISDTQDRVVKTMSWQGKAPSAFVWNGTDSAGNKVPDGEYKYDLAARDSAGNEGSARVSGIKISTVPPEISLNVGSSAFSPNGDGIKDTVDFYPKLKITSDIRSWKIQIKPVQGGSARTISGSDAPPAKLIWDGKTDGGRIAPEGEYQAILTVEYKSGQTPVTTSPRITLDLTPPSADASANPTTFSPNGDGFKDVTAITQDVNKAELWKAEIRIETPDGKTTGDLVRSFTWVGKPPKTINWDGTDERRIVLPDGKYTYQLIATDAAGNSGSSSPIEITIDNRPTPISIKLEQHWFSPGTSSKLSKLVFDPTLTLQNGIESWRLDVRTPAGATVRTLKGISTPPQTIEWDGKTDAGSFATENQYNAVFTVIYLKGDRPQVVTENFGIRTTAPQISVSADALLFSPDGDGFKDQVHIKQSSSSEQEWLGTILDTSGAVIRSWYWKGMAQDFDWDGKDENGNRQADGVYRYVVSSTDQAGNTTRQELKGITIDTRPTPLLLLADAKGFAPGTGRPGVTTINFKPVLTMTDGVVGWTLRLMDISSQTKVARILSGTGVPPAVISWDGSLDDKTIAPDGRYEGVLTVEYRKGNRPEAHSSGFLLDTTGPNAQLSISPRPFSPDDDGVDDEVNIGIAVDDMSPIKDWSLEIFDPQGVRFVVFSGQGTPTSRVVWNGRSSTGELVQSAMDYGTVLTITDSLGNKSTTKDSISVDVLVLRDGDLLRILIPGINFPGGSPDLESNRLDSTKLAQNEKTLDRIAQILRKYSSYQIQIEGHANITQFWDPALADQENRTELQPLSEKRANAVKEALVKRGIAESRMSTLGVGGSRPVVPNSDLANVWKNRRVEFILKK